MPGQLDAAMINYFADQLWQAVSEGYGENLTTVDFDSPDYTMLRKLTEDVWHFSAAKNYKQLRAFTLALVNEQGQIRSFSEYRRQVHTINDEFVGSWLKTEYNLAIASGQMSEKWMRIQEDKEVLPLLQYQTVGDDRVRPAHRELDGVTRKVDDDFWNMYYPPNGWGCRCDVIQLPDGDETPLDKIITPDDMPVMFKTNLAKKGLVFPPNHPYYIGNPNLVKETADELLRSEKG